MTDQTILTTPRLRLRPLRERDLPDLLATHRVAAVNQYLPYATWRGMEDARTWFARVRQREAAGSALYFAITLPAAAERAIGHALLFGLSKDDGRAEFGYALDRAFHGQGYGGEAAEALVAHAFAALDLRRLEAAAEARNLASHRLLLRLGFRHEGCQRQHHWNKGVLADLNLYGLLRDEWRPR